MAKKGTSVISLIRPIQPLRKAIKSIFSHNKYKLAKKISKADISKFREDKTTLYDVVTFSKARIIKKDDPNFYREIVSFYNKENKLVERRISGSNINPKIKTYKRDYSVAPDGINTYGTNTTFVQTLEKNPVTKDWDIISNEERYLYAFLDNTKNSKYAQKLHINRNIFEGTDKIHAEITEYPMTLGFEPKFAKKSLKADLNIKKGIPEIEHLESTSNLNIPEKDKFLAFRLLIGSTKQEALARYFLKQKALSNADISIVTDRCRVPKNSSAIFSSADKLICFKEVNKYSHPVSTAAHEAEHAYQHAMIGRLGCGKTKFESECKKFYGEIKDKRLIDEAKKYAEARDNYPYLTANEDLSKNFLYKNNYLELKAREAGAKAAEEYSPGRTFLQKQFQYLPDANNL